MVEVEDDKTFLNNKNDNCLASSLTMENIELNSLNYELKADLDNNNCHEKLLGYSYTPERLIRNQDYRIITEFHKSPQDLITNSTDPYKFGAQYLEALLEHRESGEAQIPISLRHRKYLKSKLSKSVDNKSEGGICLSDELASSAASSDKEAVESGRKKVAFNQVVKILESLDSNPDEADYLIEDRFTSGYSEHDRLTRLALSIEQEDSFIDDEESKDDSCDILHQLRGRVEKLQVATRGIYKDIQVLRRDFQFEDEKVELLEIETSNLRNDVNELKYLDNLLNLLRGEIERISQKNWPFIIGRSDKLCENEEMNLVV